MLLHAVHKDRIRGGDRKIRDFVQNASPRAQNSYNLEQKQISSPIGFYDS